jgi:hypothetical protein
VSGSYPLNPLVVMVPMEPAPDGNGLAMRAARFVSGASARFSVVVVVVPVSGSQPWRRPTEPQVPTVVVPVLSGEATGTEGGLVSSPVWRTRLESALPFPAPANRAPPTMAGQVLSAIVRAGVARGTPVHVMRSTLAPLGLAVAEHLDSPWCTLDLDDDDEAVAASLGDGELASAYHRLTATFAPLFDGVCAAAPFEASALGQRLGFGVAVVRNAVVVPAEVKRNPAVPAELLFVGNLDYPPNVGAATVLATQVVPGVASALHRPVNANLVGPHSPSKSLEALGKLPGVRLTGYVEDLAPLYERATAVVVPLPHGGGTSIKVLEAFAREVPVVSTRAGVRGLGVDDGTHVILGENPGELAAAVVALVRDSPRARRLAQTAREFVEQRYGAPMADREVGEFLVEVAGRPRRPARGPDPRPAAVPGTAGSR